ncbi:alanyl-tRNA synthetase [Nonomuraea rubra]|uniref:Ser-tRNA(Ala) deacylase AlaX n=1 Tax=Nonomuraea rubra TaxID=46180 RepID=A0A7X0TX73_9ACTN|nr:alanyl-tRNA synthetase [Nonomuraea rubra]MBB6547277.1 Ser-tRNA(Ala) deacylase AlaX [Nonomuraea rubra]
MQKQLYLSDTYLLDVVTQIVDADRSAPWVTLNDNIFHPQGGGQPSDQGTVDGVNARPRRAGDSVVVLDLDCAPEDAPRVGDMVTVSIDPGLRRLHAALHTAGHLIDALARRFGLCHVGNSHFPGQARVEYLLDGREVAKEGLAEFLEEGIAAAIREELPVTSSSHEGQRAVTIRGLGTDLCGGTHVPHLGMLAEVTIRSIKAKSGRLRIGYDAAHTRT